MELMPIQDFGEIHKDAYMMAYAVYAHVYGPQEALLKNGCRGGFGICEMFAFLYAHSFPKEQWRMRVNEIFDNHRKINRRY